MKIDVVTIFPEMFRGPFEESMVKRAMDNGVVEINIHDLRDWTTDNHRSVDDRPYGGGAGMVMKIEPIEKAVQSLKIKNQQSKIKNKEFSFAEASEDKSDPQIKTVLLSAKGEAYTQQKAQEYAKLDQLIMVAGHYEGVDERVAKHVVDEEIRIGDYVLTGGELPAMVIVDSLVRLLPGVLGNEESAKVESHSEPGYLEYPQYTRPEEYKGWKVPEVLLSGNHGEIEKWRKNSD